MESRFLSVFLLFLGFWSLRAVAQPVTCPAPVATSPNCYQTNRGTTFAGLTTPLWQKAPNPNQDCCNAIALCGSVNTIENGSVMPPHPNGPTTRWTTPYFPGCVRDELPVIANTCFFNNEKGTSWYKFKIRPLPGGPTTFGSPAGKLRFRIIPQDAFDDPDYDPDGIDLGSNRIGDTDYDFLLFDVTTGCSNGDQCNLIKNSTEFTNATSVIKSCNWAGTAGPTGLFEPGTGTASSVGTARFNMPLDVKVGQVFVLAIDNFSAGIQGFTVDFNPNSTITAAMGQTAIVNPTVNPNIQIKSVTNPTCSDTVIRITFSAPIRLDNVAISNFEILGQNAPYTLNLINAPTSCFGSEDTTLTFSISPATPDSTLRLVLKNQISDICGNIVLIDTIAFRIPFGKKPVHSIASIQPKCGTTRINVRLNERVLCNTIIVNPFDKFQIRRRDSLTKFCDITKIERTNGLACTATTLDSLYTFTLSKEFIDTIDLDIFIDSVKAFTIKDNCNARLQKGNIPFRISPIRIPFQFAAVQPDCDIRKINIRLDSNVLVSSMTDTLTRKRFKIVNPTDSSKFCDIVKIERTRILPVGAVLDSLFTFTLSKQLIDTTNLALYIVNDSAGKINNNCKSYLKAGFVPFQILPVKIPFQIVNTPNCGDAKINISFGRKVRCDSVKLGKFTVRIGNTEQNVTSIKSSGTCPNGVDSLFSINLISAELSSNYSVSIDSGVVIRDLCGNPAFFARKAFSVNSFLTINGIEDTVCPDQFARLSALLDTTYKGTLQSLIYTWRENSTIDTLVSRPGLVRFDGADGATRSIIELGKTVLAPTSNTYTLVVKNKLNGCMDTASIPVLFSPIPNIEVFDKRLACFGETVNLRPGITNGLLNNFDYMWSRIGKQSAPNKVISNDSILTLGILDSLLVHGSNQDYQVEIAFKKSLGGCKALAPVKVNLVIGRKIEAKIGLIPDDSVASILPADFTFSNLSKFTPNKNTPYFKWDFNIGTEASPQKETKESRGYNSEPFRFNEPGKFWIKLTAFDTLFRNANEAGRICTNSDSVQIYTQNLIPSLVTSNGDGKNDFLSIQGMRPNSFSMKLYNRWGKLVGEQDPFDNVVGWDPKDVGAGSYYYLLTEKRSGKTIVSWLTISKD